MRIAFVYEAGRLRRLERVLARALPTEFFFGAIELARRGHEVAYFEAMPEVRGGVREALLGRLYRRELLPSKAYPGLIRSVATLLPRLRGFDVVVGTTSGLAFALGLQRALGRLRSPVVAIQLGLADGPDPRWVRHRLNGWLLRRMWSQVLGDAERPRFQAMYALPDARFEVNQFGVDPTFWTPDDGPEGDYVLSVGNDGRRDYELLMEAAAKVDGPFLVVTAREIQAPVPPNVTRRSGTWHGEEVGEVELRDLYRRARCVVIPLVESDRPSGQAVCLQAMACGRPVVLTRTAGLWSTAMIRDGGTALLVSPGDAVGLTHAIAELLGDREQRRRLGAAGLAMVRAEATIDGFAERLEAFCAKAIAAGG